MTDFIFEGLLSEFLLEAQERVEKVEESLLGLSEALREDRQEILNGAKRELHTLKGNSGMMGFGNIQALSHRLEDMVVTLSLDEPRVEEILKGLDRLRLLLDAVKNTGMDTTRDEVEGGEGKGAGSEQREEGGGAKPAAVGVTEGDLSQGSVRVSFAALDELVDLFAEMVIFRNKLADSVSRGKDSRVYLSHIWSEIESAEEDLGKALSFIHDKVMHLRMVPLHSLFKRLKRIVHDESAKERKLINLTVSGGETPLDKALLELANEALGHLVRNSVIHGIERPEERSAVSKPETGTIRISAVMQSGEVLIDVEDDGGGIDEAGLLRVAEKKGIDYRTLDNLYDLLFLPGVTTKESADMSSGRGIGLSAVLEAVQRQGGRIEVASERYMGTRFRLRLPLSVSITRALIFVADGEEYALPLQFIVESLHFREGDSHEMNSACVFKWREKVIPVIDVGVIAGTAEQSRQSGYVIIIESDQKQRGLVVDGIVGIREIVVKGMDATIEPPKWVAGVTISGDGRTLLILDAASLIAIKPFVERNT